MIQNWLSPWGKAVCSFFPIYFYVTGYCNCICKFLQPCWPRRPAVQQYLKMFLSVLASKLCLCGCGSLWSGSCGWALLFDIYLKKSYLLVVKWNALFSFIWLALCLSVTDTGSQDKSKAALFFGNQVSKHQVAKWTEILDSFALEE